MIHVTYTNSFETDVLVAEFTKTGTGTHAKSSTYKQAGSYSMKLSGDDMSYTYVRKSATTTNINIVDTYMLLAGTVAGYNGVVVENAAGQDMCSVYFSNALGTGLILRAGTATPTELGSASYARWYHVVIEIDQLSDTYSVWLDDVEVVTDKALENATDAYNTVTYKFANVATQNLYIDTHQHSTWRLIDTFIACLSAAGYTFVKGNPFDGRDFNTLYTNHITWKYNPGVSNNVKRWEFTLNFFHTDIDEGMELSDELGTIIGNYAANVNAPFYNYIGPINKNGTKYHYSSMTVNIWET